MVNALLRSAAVFALLAFAGPGLAGEAKRKVLGSCQFPKACADYDDAKEAARTRCGALKGEWRDKACPKAKLVATCVNEWSDGFSYTRFYAPTKKQEAKKLCEDGLGELR